MYASRAIGHLQGDRMRSFVELSDSSIGLRTMFDIHWVAR